MCGEVLCESGNFERYVEVPNIRYLSQYSG
jgi:hypothetical protein